MATAALPAESPWKLTPLLRLPAATGRSRTYHHADITGPSGELLGRVRYALTFRRPAGELLRAVRTLGSASALADLDLSDALTAAMLRVSCAGMLPGCGLGWDEHMWLPAEVSPVIRSW